MSEFIQEFDLKSCPFCGGEAQMESWDMSPFERSLINDESMKWYYVFCDECCAQGPDCSSADQAAEQWNKRVCQ